MNKTKKNEKIQWPCTLSNRIERGIGYMHGELIVP